MLSQNKDKELRNSIIAQIESKFSGKQKEEILSTINSLNSEQLEEFLKQNSSTTPTEIFREIAKGKIPSHKIDEDKDALAVLEINPISKGHIIIIPREKITDPNSVPESIAKFSKKIGDLIQSKLSPKGVEMLNTTMFGEVIINVLPVYENETMDSQRNPAKEEELKEVQSLLTSKQEEKQEIKIEERPAKPEPLDSKKMWLPKRIP